MNQLLDFVAGLDHSGKKAVRLGMVIVLLWIGGLKFFTYEADGIVPFIANSPFMSFLYKDPAGYKMHVNKEGELIPVNHQWHTDNNTYAVSIALGVFLVLVAMMVAVHSVWPFVSMTGSILLFFTMLGTLSFLITTPETWVPHLSDQQWGFPFLSGRGRLVIKDLVMLGGSLITMSESAQLYLGRRTSESINPLAD